MRARGIFCPVNSHIFLLDLVPSSLLQLTGIKKVICQSHLIILQNYTLYEITISNANISMYVTGIIFKVTVLY